MRRYSILAAALGALAVAPVALVAPAAARVDEVAAFYRATWAGLPAAELSLSFGQAASGYHDEIHIETKGAPHWLTKFRAGAVAEGRFGEDGAAIPLRYEALYDLRKRRNSRISLRFIAKGGALLAERTAEDTSRKVPLPAIYRRNVADPLSALASVRHVLAIHAPKPGSEFRVPVYDGARRFDVAVSVIGVGGEEDVIRLKLTLMPIAGFKGQHSDDGDPDDAPRPVEATLTHDERLMPLMMRVSIAYLPLIVRFEHSCASIAHCGAAADVRDR